MCVAAVVTAAVVWIAYSACWLNGFVHKRASSHRTWRVRVYPLPFH